MRSQDTHARTTAKRIVVWARHTLNANVSEMLTLLFAWAVQYRVRVTPAQLREIATRAHALRADDTAPPERL